MNYFTKLITKSYLEYTNEKDMDVTLFFFQEYIVARDNPKKTKGVLTKNYFFKKLIKKIDTLIEDTYFEVKKKPTKELTAEDLIIAAEVKRDEDFMNENDAAYMLYLGEKGIDYTPPQFRPPTNWEECEDVEELVQARNDGKKIKDPFTIVSIIKKNESKKIILRKSKLENLRNEVINARNADVFNEVIEVKELNKNLKSKEGITSSEDLINIEEVVRKHFNFTLEYYHKTKGPMLSEEDFLKLVNWVTYFLGNNYELPNIDAPIMEVYIGKTKIKSAFKNLIHLYHPKRNKPKSFYALVSKCFYALQDETVETIQKTSDPDKPVN